MTLVAIRLKGFRFQTVAIGIKYYNFLVNILCADMPMSGMQGRCSYGSAVQSIGIKNLLFESDFSEMVPATNQDPHR